jgi:hypothetical protein
MSTDYNIESLADGWGRASTTTAVLHTLDEKIGQINALTEQEKIREKKYEASLQATLKEVYDKQKNKSLGISGSKILSSDAMDVDEPSELSKGKNRKYVAT